MDQLKRIRNDVEDLCSHQLPETVLSEPARVEIQRSLAEKVLQSMKATTYSVSVIDNLLVALSNFATLQEHSKIFFQLEFDIIEAMFHFVFVPQYTAPYRRVDLVIGIREAVEHQRRNLVSPSLGFLDWQKIVDMILTVYSDGARSGYISTWSSRDRDELIEELIKLLKETVHFTKPKALIEFALTELLGRVDLLDQTAPDTIDLAFTVLGQFPGDELLEHVVNRDEIWTFIARQDVQEATWLTPRVELHMFTVLSKLDPRHFSKINYPVFEHALKRTLSLGIEWIGLPSSATSPGGSTPSVETAGLYRQNGSLVGVDRRRMAGKLARLAVSLIWTTNSPVFSDLGWKFLHILAARTQSLILPSVTSKQSGGGSFPGEEGGGSDRWPYRLSDVYTSLVTHWLRRKTKSDFIHQDHSPDHARFVCLLMPGVSNVVMNTMAGGIGYAVATKYVSVFVNLARIFGEDHNSGKVLLLAQQSLEDVHKSAMHGLLLLAGITPLASLVAVKEFEFLSFLLDYSVEHIDTTNLMRTVSILGLLDVVFCQTPHKWTLCDLSLVGHSGQFLALSAAFPDFACRLVEKLLLVAPNLPKAKAAGGSSLMISAMSSEAMEIMGRSLVLNLFEWIVFNVDESTRNRIQTIMQDFISSSISLLSGEGKVGLVGNMLTVLMSEKFNQNTLTWLMGKLNLVELDARGNSVYLSLIGHAIRKAGRSRDIAPLIPKLESIITKFLTSPKTSLALKKIAAKVVQRLAEALGMYYVVDRCSYDSSLFNDPQFLLAAVSKPGTDIETAWWSSPGARSVNWHIPSGESIALLCQFLRSILAAVSHDQELLLRLYIALGKSIQHTIAFPSDENHQLRDLYSSCINWLARMSLPADDVRTVSLWLKAARFLLPFARAESSGASETTNAILRQISGFKIENLLEFGYIGKEYESLDATRPEYISTRLEELFSNIVDMRLGSIALTDPHVTIIRRAANMVLTSPFDKLKVGGLLVVKSSADLVRETDLDSFGQILDVAFNEVISLLRVHPVEKISKDEANGMSIVFNLIGDMGSFVAFDSGKTEELFLLLAPQLVRTDLDPETMDGLMNVVRSVWSDRLKSHLVLDNSNSQSSALCHNLLEDFFEKTPGMYWKSQTSILALGYMSWRAFGSVSHSTCMQIIAVLTRILCKGHLAKTVADLIVFWIHVLIIVDPESIKSLSSDHLVSIFRTLSITNRFGTGTGRAGPEFSGYDISGSDLHLNLFSSSKIPRIKNKGVDERNMAFWYQISQHSNILEDVLNQVLIMVSGETVEDDMHCAAFELFAGSAHLLDQLTHSRYMEYILSQIGRGDGALVPTIAAAVRIGIVGLGHPSMIDNGTKRRDSNEEFNRVFQYLWTQLGKYQSDTTGASSTLMKSRILVVINNAVLIDLSLLAQLDHNMLRNTFMADLANEGTSQQVREIAAGVLARLALVDRSGETEKSLVLFIQELADMNERPSSGDDSGAPTVIGEESLDNEIAFKIQIKVAVLQLVGRIIKFKRVIPKWIVPVVRIAIECVGNHREEVKRDGVKFFQLLARFMTRDNAVAITTDPNFHVHAPKEKDALIALLSDSLINGLTRMDSPLWSCQSLADMRKCIEKHLVTAIEECLFVQHVHSPIRVDESTNPSSVSAACDALIDSYMIMSACMHEQGLDAPERLSSVRGILTLSAFTYVASLFYEVPRWGVEAIGKLANALTRDAPPNVKRLAQTTLADFLKTQTDRGTREKTEQLFDSDVLGLIRSSRNRHSYIS